MLWTLTVLAVGAGVAVEAGLDKSEATVGELVAYHLTVHHPDSLTVPTPSIIAPPGVRVTSTAVPQVRTLEPGSMSTTFDYALAAYRTGTFILPPTNVVLLGPAGEDNSVQTDTLFFSVRSVLEAGADTTAIRDVKRPIPPGWVPPLWALLLGVAVLAGGAVVGVARIRRRSPRPAAPSRPPEEIARERINRLRGVVPGDDAALKEYYSDISFLVREYIEGKLSLPALECTTAELLGRLAGVEGKERWISALERLLLEADLVKFAKHRPALDQGRRALADAEEVVEVIARHQAALRSPMEGSHLKAESASGKLEGSPG